MACLKTFRLSRTRWNVLIVVILAAGMAWTAASRVTTDQATRDRARRATPDIILDTLDGGQFKLSDQIGQPVVVNFWATWCLPCRAEMPAFEEVYRNHRDQGLVVVGVDVAESPDVVAKFVSEAGATFPIALDVSGEVTELYRIQGMPTTFFVGRDGKIKDTVIGGPLTKAAIESKVNDLLVR
jgi:cytochrome c biogenesis protein CcmG, thiol:disulfide interchange protein DsbE